MNEVIARLAADRRLRPSHVSLYAAIVFSGSCHADAVVVAQAKGSRTTYYRCLSDLRRWGYPIK